MSNIDQELLKIYTSKSQADKAISSLKGLLLVRLYTNKGVVSEKVS